MKIGWVHSSIVVAAALVQFQASGQSRKIGVFEYYKTYNVGSAPFVQNASAGANWNTAGSVPANLGASLVSSLSYSPQYLPSGPSDYSAPWPKRQDRLESSPIQREESQRESSPQAQASGYVKPAKYFDFFCNSLPSSKKIDKLIETHGKDQVVIGVSSAAKSVKEIERYEATIREIKSKGGRVFFYSEGVFDPNFGGGERERQQFAQRHYKTGPWQPNGWRNFYHKQIERCQVLGCDDYEIDNMSRVGIERNGKTFVKFLKEHEDYMKGKGFTLPKFTLKNPSVELIKATRDAIKKGLLDRSYLSDFLIIEEGYKSQWAEVARIAETIGIQLAGSGDTRRYQAHQAYRVRQDRVIAEARPKAPGQPQVAAVAPGRN